MQPSLRIRGFWSDIVYLNHRIGNIIWRYTKYLPKCALCDISWPLRSYYSSAWKMSVFHNELTLINSFDKITIILFKKLQNLLQDKNKSNLVWPLRSYFILWKTEKLCLLMLVLNLLIPPKVQKMNEEGRLIFAPYRRLPLLKIFLLLNLLNKFNLPLIKNPVYSSDPPEFKDEEYISLLNNLR